MVEYRPRRNPVSEVALIETGAARSPTSVVKVPRPAHSVLVRPAGSESGVLPRLRPGGGALAFEQLQDALRVLPDRADVAEH
jgi:hypothetical protein